MATLIDSYSESNQDSVLMLYSGLDVKGAQSFTAAGNILESCTFYLRKVGSPTGTLTAELYAHDGGTYGSGGKPTGSAIATSVNSITVATGITTSFILYNFYFNGTNQFRLVSGAYYFICLTFTSTSSDSNNRVEIGRDTSSPTHAGNAARFGSVWNSSTSDLCFYVYSTNLHIAVPTRF